MMYISLQLHITGKCNLACKHCYIQEHVTEMPFSQVKRVLRQFDGLIRALKKRYQQPVLPQLRITGGEPFLHKDIHRILHYVKRKKYDLGIMSNGTVLDEKTIHLLSGMKRLQPFQVSLDGNEQIHDRLRGKGNFQKVTEALARLHSHGIKTRVSFTAHQDNYQAFPEVAEVCERYHVTSLWSDRYIPFADGLIKPIDSKSMEAYNAILLQTQKQYHHLQIENYRSLQFIGTENTPYYCKAGEALITVDEHGNIMPCRRLPIICGNIQKSSLSDVYFYHDTFIQLREHKLDAQCMNCQYKHLCKGGARCMSYAVYGEYDRCDPGCFLA